MSKSTSRILTVLITIILSSGLGVLSSYFYGESAFFGEIYPVRAIYIFHIMLLTLIIGSTLLIYLLVKTPQKQILKKLLIISSPTIINLLLYIVTGVNLIGDTIFMLSTYIPDFK